MKARKYLQRSIMIAILLGTLWPAAVTFAEDTPADLEQRLHELENEVEQTDDIFRLMDIASELGDLSSRLEQLSGGLPAVPMYRSKTPDEEINREILAINGAFERQKLAFAGYKGIISAELVPFQSARKLHGSIEVRGSNQKLASETPYEGGVSRTLQYTIREDFVGYLLTTEYYNPKTGTFTDKKDYWIKTISQKIPAPLFSGKECIETVGNNWKACQKWEQYGSYQIGKGNKYPAVHEWTVGGSPKDDGILLKVETPNIVFSTVHNSRSRAQGCFGADIFISNVDFALDIGDDKLAVQQSVGGDFHGTPHCGKGSSVALNIELCKETPRCEQLESLLSNVLWAIELRDKYGAMSKVADSEAELHSLVNLDLNDRYPNLDIQDKEYLDQNAGGYNIQTGETVLPNLCKGCATMPLCMWDMEGLRIHEKTHELDVLADPDLKRLFTDTLYQAEKYNNTANDVAKAQAQAWGEMDRHAYDENARYLMDILQLELSRSQGCSLSPGFYSDLDKALQALQ
ncbi:MAG: hypothetical protein WCA04_03050 [Geobacteraceae bacterium]